MGTRLKGHEKSCQRSRQIFNGFCFLKYTLQRLCRGIRQLCGDDAYERYLAHHAVCHIETQLGQAILGSVVFPLVVIAMVQFSRADLASRQSFWLAAHCFATFWLAYCLTLLVKVLERPSGSQAEGKPLPAAAPSAAGEARGEVTRGAEPPLGDPRDGNRWAAETVFTLEASQGRWWWEGAEAELRPWKKVVEITGDKFTFSVVSSPDCRQVVACAEVSLEVGSCRRLRLSADDALGISL